MPRIWARQWPGIFRTGYVLETRMQESETVELSISTESSGGLVAGIPGETGKPVQRVI